MEFGLNPVLDQLLQRWCYTKLRLAASRGCCVLRTMYSWDRSADAETVSSYAVTQDAALHWLCVERRIKYKIAVLTFNLINI